MLPVLLVILAALLSAAAALLVLYYFRVWIEVEITRFSLPTARAGLALAAARPPTESVCVIIPAHNESAVITGLVASLRAQDYPHARFVLALDRCTDDTAARARAALSTPASTTHTTTSSGPDPRFEIIEIDSCPPDWAGKVHAAYAGYTRSTAAASADLLLFADADTLFAPACLRATLALRRARNLDLLSLLSTLTTRTWFERVAQPPAALELLHQYPLRRANRTRRQRPFANGQFMLFTAAAYRAVGTHAAVKAALLEDLLFAHLAADIHHLRTGCFIADGLLHCRMYPTWAAFRRGWKRIFTEAAHRRPHRLQKFALRTRFVGSILPALTLLTPLFSHLLWPALAPADAARFANPLLALALAGLVLYFVALARIALIAHATLWSLPAQIIGSWLVASILSEAARDLRTNTPTVWGGRTYQRDARATDSPEMMAPQVLSTSTDAAPPAS